MKSQIFEQNSDCAHFVTFTIWQNMLTQLQYVSEQTRGFFQIQMNHYIHRKVLCFIYAAVNMWLGKGRYLLSSHHIKLQCYHPVSLKMTHNSHEEKTINKQITH